MQSSYIRGGGSFPTFAIQALAILALPTEASTNAIPGGVA